MERSEDPWPRPRFFAYLACLVTGHKVPGHPEFAPPAGWKWVCWRCWHKVGREGT